MSKTSKTNDLIHQISSELDLSPEDQVDLRKLIKAYEASTNTMATIEPDDDYQDNDAELLPVLEQQELNYDTLLSQARWMVRKAFHMYLDRRGEILTK